jgi:hypothetical protein
MIADFQWRVAGSSGFPTVSVFSSLDTGGNVWPDPSPLISDI